MRRFVYLFCIIYTLIAVKTSEFNQPRQDLPKVTRNLFRVQSVKRVKLFSCPFHQACPDEQFEASAPPKATINRWFHSHNTYTSHKGCRKECLLKANSKSYMLLHNNQIDWFCNIFNLGTKIQNVSLQY